MVKEKDHAPFEGDSIDYASMAYQSRRITLHSTRLQSPYYSSFPVECMPSQARRTR